jgi:dTDP-4-dehydrorhamnose reductase
MRVLITGSDGQISTSLKKYFPQESGENIYLPKNQLDITNENSVKEAFKSLNPEIVINTAAFTKVDDAEKNIQTAFLVNEVGPRNLASACKEWSAHLIHLSSDYVFDGKNNSCYQENHPTNPLNIYGKSKLAGEQAIIDSGSLFTIIRTSWLFSEFGTNFLKTMLKISLQEEPIKIIDDQIGAPTYAGDLAFVLRQLTKNLNTKNYVKEIFHYGGFPYVSWYQFAEKIFSLAVKENVISSHPVLMRCSSEDLKLKAKRPAFSALNSKKIEGLLNIPPSNWELGIKNSLNNLKHE